MDTRGAEGSCLKHFAVSEFEGTTKGGRYHGFGQVCFTGNNEYVGAFEDGRMHGLGTMSWNDGLKYVGQWSHNSATGSGSLSWPNGTEYFGEVVKGRRQGSGVLFHGDNMYSGEWHAGKRHGFGIQVTPSVVYRGEWVNGQRTGWGHTQFVSGNVYDGTWLNDAMHGFGSFTWVTNRRLHTNEQLQAALSTAPDGVSAAVAAESPQAQREYVRMLRRVLANVGSASPGPLGPYTPSCVESSDAYERYIGEFQQNLPHGTGQYEMHFFDGSTRDIPFDTINQYNGSFRQGLRDGFGVQKYADGTLYEGSWSANLKHGKGSIIHGDGTFDEVEMDHDVPKLGRPSTARANAQDTANVSVEECLEIDDFFLSKADREDVKDILTRYKCSLKHLFICYSKLWQPQDYGAMMTRILVSECDVPLLHWQSRVDSDISEKLVDGLARYEVNHQVTLTMCARADAKARRAAQKAIELMQTAAEEYASFSKQLQGRESSADADAAEADNDDFLSNLNEKKDASLARASRKRPATPLNESGVVRSELGPPPAAPLSASTAASRRERLSLLTVGQLHALLRDALALDGEMTVSMVNDVIADTVNRHDPKRLNASSKELQREASNGGAFSSADFSGATLTFRAFVECLLRLAEAKFSRTSTFAAVSTSRKWSTADRLEFLLEHFLEPLRCTLSEVQLCGELAQFDWPTYVAESAGGDHTMEDLRRMAYRIHHREQQRAATAAQQRGTLSSPSGKGGNTNKDDDADDNAPVTLTPMMQEEFQASVADRSCYPLCPRHEVEIVTIDVVSTKGTRRSHQLYLLRCSGGGGESGAAASGSVTVHYAGVVPSYHPSVCSVDVYDAIAAFPTKLLQVSTSVRPFLERHLRLLYRCFTECFNSDHPSGGDRRANFGRFLVWLMRRGIVVDTTTSSKADGHIGTSAHGSSEDRDDGLSEVEHDSRGAASRQPSDQNLPQRSHAAAAASSQQSVSPTTSTAAPCVSVDIFVRVVLEMELSCYVLGRQEYCCPSVFFERKAMVTKAVYDDPSVRTLIRASPEFAEAVDIAVKYYELWDERRRSFTVPQYQVSSRWWWLLAHRIDFTFAQFIDVVVRLALQMYGTTDVSASMAQCLQRLQQGELGPTPAAELWAAVMPPPKIDKPAVVQRNRSAPAAAVDDKGKSGAGKRPPGKK